MAFAIIKTGGKQYKVSEGDVLKVEKLPGAARPEGKVVFEEVLLTDNGEETVVGAPIVKGAKVEAQVVADGRAPKIRVVRYKAKVRYHKVYGHRQPFTEVKIIAIKTS